MPSDDYSVFEETEDDGSTTQAKTDDATAKTTETLNLGHKDERGCPKCGCTEADFDEIATSGSGLTKLFDIQNRQFTVVSCVECGYSELYRGQSKHNVLDFFLGG
ncbi:zinc ribbon domain-containing protein [Halalkalirubrum salinum]|uniref:zinc ribbon domain-containing protein n=1 Tax=Halalkalirubrum salinum TaxID=2563889 RepID=UPI0010FBAB73|nr:zinc ribbon domain-containing protein [Halalkalirubrum salinum]